MKNKHLTIITLTSASLFCATPLWETTCKAAEPAELTAPAPVYTTTETAEFITLAKATLDALAVGKQTEMVAKLTDLETAWDDKAKALKAKDSATWTLLDETLDKSISALRSSRTDLVKGKAALEDLIKKLGQATKA